MYGRIGARPSASMPHEAGLHGACLMTQAPALATMKLGGAGSHPVFPLLLLHRFLPFACTSPVVQVPAPCRAAESHRLQHWHGVVCEIRFFKSPAYIERCSGNRAARTERLGSERPWRTTVHRTQATHGCNMQHTCTPFCVDSAVAICVDGVSVVQTCQGWPPGCCRCCAC
jgi:hypothetical protein